MTSNGRIQYIHSYKSIISMENIIEAWEEFICGKRNRKDAQEFERSLMANLLSLHQDLLARIYKHGAYEAFEITDPKRRQIHKATVRDRLLHRALYRKLYPFFDRTFIAHSYSCRVNKGTHRALRAFATMARQVSKKHTKTAWVLKCDIRKCFTSIDRDVLLQIIKKYVADVDIQWLISEILSSFNCGTGLPLGNLTSQLFVNVYMNQFDQFVKHKLKAHYYIRYADDFVIFSQDKSWLQESVLPVIKEFLSTKLGLTLHPQKVSIASVSSGVDFLGWVHFPHHRVLRTATRKRMFRNIPKSKTKKATVESYLGLLSHGNAHTLENRIRNMKV